MAHVLPSGGGKGLIDIDDALLLCSITNPGLFQTVKDVTVAELRANVSALARASSAAARSTACEAIRTSSSRTRIARLWTSTLGARARRSINKTAVQFVITWLVSNIAGIK